jgi:hypothetical protein
LDFGYIEPGSTHRGRFLVRNPLTVPLGIRETRSECLCVKVTSWPRGIPAGQSRALESTFLAPEKPLQYAKRIILLTDRAELAQITLTIAARVGLPLRLEPEVLELGEVAAQKECEQEVTVLNDGRKPVRLLYSSSGVKGLYARVPRRPLEPGGALRVPIVFAPRSAGGGLGAGGTLQIRTDSENQRSLSLRVRYGRGG